MDLKRIDLSLQPHRNISGKKKERKMVSALIFIADGTEEMELCVLSLLAGGTDSFLNSMMEFTW